MSEQNEALIRRWFEEVWNQRREETIDELMAEHVNAIGLPPEPLHGPTAFKAFYRPFIAAFPQLTISVEEAYSRGDRVAFRCSVKGTHRSGRTCEFDGGGFVTVRDGKLAEGHNIWNFHDMLAQVGAVPADAFFNALGPG